MIRKEPKKTKQNKKIVTWPAALAGTLISVSKGRIWDDLSRPMTRKFLKIRVELNSNAIFHNVIAPTVLFFATTNNLWIIIFFPLSNGTNNNQNKKPEPKYRHTHLHLKQAYYHYHYHYRIILFITGVPCCSVDIHLFATIYWGYLVSLSLSLSQLFSFYWFLRSLFLVLWLLDKCFFKPEWGSPFEQYHENQISM